ncbi:hypothetical protein BKI52_03995 [marine bacterium AO1-C]|nr:hypothetical protein BKI52_03995 [marine bacterium AO1-C]
MTTRSQTPEIETTSGSINIDIQALARKKMAIVSWMQPGENVITTQTQKYLLKACIKSLSNIDGIKIYVNNQAMNDVTTRGLKPKKGQCNGKYYQKEVSLLKGINQVTLEVTNLAGKIVSEPRIINYIPKVIDTLPNISEQAKNGQFYALIVGVGDYVDASIEDLSNPVKDAQQLYNVLTNQYKFAPKNVVFLKNPTRSDLVNTLDEMQKMVKEEDNFLMFYAGHGYWDKRINTGYWLPANAKKESTANWFRNSTMRDYIASIKAKHTLLIADACFSGGIFQTRGLVDNDAPIAIKELYRSPSRTAMTSGSLSEVPDQSVFLKYLIKRLKENQQTYLSAEKLYSSIKEKVIGESPNHQRPKYGVISQAGDEEGDFIFIKKK